MERKHLVLQCGARISTAQHRRRARTSEREQRKNLTQKTQSELGGSVNGGIEAAATWAVVMATRLVLTLCAR